MSLLTINLQDKLIAENRHAQAADNAALAQEAALDAQIEKLRVQAESAVATDRETIVRELGFVSYQHPQAQKVKATRKAYAYLPQERIFSREAIKRMCITYGLRCLPTERYRGALDAGIVPAVGDFKALLKANDKQLNGAPFFIAAPSAAFELRDRPAPDPLLFVRLDGETYYLIHKWGNDLSVLARVKNWSWDVITHLLLAPALATFLIYLGHEGRTGANIAMCVVGGILALGSLIAIMPMSIEEKWWYHNVTRRNWNTDFKD